MYREKTIIKCRKNEKGSWNAKIGKITRIDYVGLSRLFRFLSVIIADKNKIYAIDVIVKRRR